MNALYRLSDIIKPQSAFPDDRHCYNLPVAPFFRVNPEKHSVFFRGTGQNMQIFLENSVRMFKAYARRLYGKRHFLFFKAPLPIAQYDNMPAILFYYRIYRSNITGKFTQNIARHAKIPF